MCMHVCLHRQLFLSPLLLPLLFSPLPLPPSPPPLPPQDSTQWSQYKLSEAQVDQYWRDGYISNIRVLADEQCDLLLQDYQVFLVSIIKYWNK